MTWRRPGDKPLSEPMMASSPTHICVTRPQWVNLSLRWVSDGYPILRQTRFSSFMVTSSNGNIFRVTSHLCGNSPVIGEFPTLNDWVKNREVGDLRRLSAHYDVIVMFIRYVFDKAKGFPSCGWRAGGWQDRQAPLTLSRPQFFTDHFQTRQGHLLPEDLARVRFWRFCRIKHAHNGPFNGPASFGIPELILSS